MVRALLAASADPSLRDAQVSSLRPFFLEKQTKKKAQPNAQQLKFMKEAEARKVAHEALLEQTKVQNTLVVEAARGRPPCAGIVTFHDYYYFFE